ncbi:hypothetical protein CBM2626_A40329 [Cupriavidus taiwanensis]|nr:hypothetical protein CBM2626_A40329 [Cupriavidus taiwanensis]
MQCLYSYHTRLYLPPKEGIDEEYLTKNGRYD